MIKLGVNNNIFFSLFSFLKSKNFFDDLNIQIIPVDNYSVLKSLFDNNYFDIIFTDAGYIESKILKNQDNFDFYIFPISFKNFYKILVQKEFFSHRREKLEKLIVAIPDDSKYFKNLIFNFIKFYKFEPEKVIFKSINEKDVEFFFQKKDIHLGISIAPYVFDIMNKNLATLSNYIDEENLSCNCLTFYFKKYLVDRKDFEIKTFFDSVYFAINILINDDYYNEDFSKFLPKFDKYFIDLFKDELKNNFYYNDEFLRIVMDFRKSYLRFFYTESVKDSNLYKKIQNTLEEENNRLKLIKNKDCNLNNVKDYNYENIFSNILDHDKIDLKNNKDLNLLIKDLLNKKQILNNKILPSVLTNLINNIIYENEIISLKNKYLLDKLKTLEDSLDSTKSNLYNLFEELNKTSENLLIQKIRADEAIKIKSKFFASITHDLKTPIFGIDAIIDKIIKMENDKEKLDYLLKIKRSTETLISLIEDLLTISKAEDNKLNIAKKIFNFSDLLKELYDNISARLSQKNVKLVFDISNKIPRFLKGDNLRIKQIFYNLLGNSSKFTENGYIKLVITPELYENNIIRLNCVVEDTGIGISKEKLNKIFEPFEQENEDIKYKYGGSGLGLSIVKRLVELMDGQIYCESEIGKGSKFIFFIYLNLPEDSEIKDFVDLQNEKILKNKKINLYQSNILIAEDNEVNIAVIKDILKDFNNIKYKIVNNGKDALMEALTGSYNLLITDMQMPKMDGGELAYKIRNNNLAINIVCFSGYEEDILGDSLKIYFNEIVSKPYTKEKFYNIFSKYLGLTDKFISEAIEIKDDIYEKKIKLNENNEEKSFNDKNEELKEENKEKNIDDFIGVSSYEKLKKMFIEETLKKLEQFNKSIIDKDLKTLRFIGHNLKGTAPMFGYKNLGEIGKEISLAIKEEDFDRLNKIKSKFENEIKKIIKK